MAVFADVDPTSNGFVKGRVEEVGPKIGFYPTAKCLRDHPERNSPLHTKSYLDLIFSTLPETTKYGRIRFPISFTG